MLAIEPNANTENGHLTQWKNGVGLRNAFTEEGTSELDVNDA